MNRDTENKLLTSLTKAIDEWWDGVEESTMLPYVGNNLCEIMARAALSVLVGIADTEEYLSSEGLLEAE